MNFLMRMVFLLYENINFHSFLLETSHFRDFNFIELSYYLFNNKFDRGHFYRAFIPSIIFICLD